MRLLGGPARAVVAATAALALVVPLAPAAHAVSTEISASGSGVVQTGSTFNSRTYSMSIDTSSVELSGIWAQNASDEGVCDTSETVFFTTSGSVRVDNLPEASQLITVESDCSGSASFDITSAEVGDSIEFTYGPEESAVWYVDINVVEPGPAPEPEPEPEPEPIVIRPPNTPAMGQVSQATDVSNGPVKVSATWRAPATSATQPVTGYVATVADGRETVGTCRTTTTSCVVSNLPRLRQYSVFVRATNSAGQSPPSITARARTTPQPPTVTNAKSEQSESGVRILADITPPRNDGGWAVTGYRCRVTNVDTGRTQETFAVEAGNRWSCDLNDFDERRRGERGWAGSAVEIEVRTLLLVGFVPSTSAWVGRSVYVPGPPTAPEILSLRASANRNSAGIALFWTASATSPNGPDSVSGYTVTARAESRRLPDVTCQTDGFTGCGLVGLKPEGVYSVSVTARTNLGQEATSPPEVVDFSALKPAPVTDVVWKDSLRRPAVWWSLPQGGDIAPILGQHVEIFRAGRWIRIEPGSQGLREVGENRFRFDDRGTAWRTRVRVTSTVGAGPWTVFEPTKITSEPTVRATPGIGSMRVSFGDCEPNQGIVYRYLRSGGTEWSEGRADCEQTVTPANLEPGDYEIQAAAEGVLGRSQFASDSVRVWAPLAKPTGLTLEYRQQDNTFLAGWAPGPGRLAAPADYLDAELWACGRAFTRLDGKGRWPSESATRIRFAAPDCLRDGDEVTLVVRSVRDDARSEWSGVTARIPFWKPTRQPLMYLNSQRLVPYRVDMEIAKAYCTASGSQCRGQVRRPDRSFQQVKPPSIPSTVDADRLTYEIELESRRTGEVVRLTLPHDGQLRVDSGASGFGDHPVQARGVEISDSTMRLRMNDVLAGSYRARARLLYTPTPQWVERSPWSAWSNSAQVIPQQPRPVASDMIAIYPGFAVDVIEFCIPKDAIYGLSRLDMFAASGGLYREATLDRDTPPIFGGLRRLANGDYLATYNFYNNGAQLNVFNIGVQPYVGGEPVSSPNQYVLEVNKSSFRPFRFCGQ